MPTAALLAYSDRPDELDRIEAALGRYTGDYEVVAASTLGDADAQLAGRGGVVAVIAAGTDAEELLRRVRQRQPHAQRVLVIPWANRSATRPVLAAITQGRFDRYAFVPDSAADERFHLVVTEILRDHQQRTSTGARPARLMVTLVGLAAQPRSYEVRDLLQRSGLPFEFVVADSAQGLALLTRAGVVEGPFPVLIRFDGEALADPSNESAAAFLGARHSDESGVFDLVIVGAGPAGLSAAVSAASEGLRTIMVDAETIGGQAGTSSLIRNYPGFPLGISGADLCNRALDQAWSFGAQTSVLRRATGLARRDRLHVVSFDDGSEIVTRAVLLATGAAYRRIGVPSLEALVGAGVFYGGGVTEGPALAGQPVVVVGGGNSAGQAAMHLARHAGRVCLVVRGASLAASMSDYLVRQIRDSATIDVLLHTSVTGGRGSGRLEELELTRLASGATETLAAPALFVQIGAIPNTAWSPQFERDRHGFLLTDRDLAATPDGRIPLPGETSVAGVFAAGDVRHGSVKRVAAAVGEGGVCVRSVHEYLALPVAPGMQSL